MSRLGWAVDVHLMPLQHGNNVDDILCLVVPMLILGAIFLYVMRRSANEEEDDSEESPDADAPPPDDGPEPVERAQDDPPDDPVPEQ